MDSAPSRRSFKRFNALHLLYLGAGIEVVLKNARISARTLRLWIQLFNHCGIDGLIARPPMGRPRKLSSEQFQEKVVRVLENPSMGGHRHWTAVKLHGYLRKELQLDLSYSSVLRYLHQHHYKRLFPQPVPQAPDSEQWKAKRKAYQQHIETLIKEPGNRIWFCDESGFEGDPRPRQRWAKKGSRPTVGYHGGHLRRSVVGAVAPDTGQITALVVSHCNTEVFQAFLDTFAAENPPDSYKHYMVLDNASWHKSASINWHHITALFLPPYSPDFNPIERLWLEIKRNHLADFITNDSEALTQEISKAILALMNDQHTTQSVCSFRH